MPQWPRAIKEDVLFNKRAEYGKQVLKNLSKRLNERYGKGWGYKTLQHCVRAAYTFSESDLEQKVIDQVEEFMHEMGDDFSLIERIYVAGHTNT